MARVLNIDLVKILSCICITNAHLAIMGYIDNFNAVSCLAGFFMISGYFVLKNLNDAREKGKEFTYLGFIWYKFKSFFPYLLASEIAIFGLILYTNLNYYHNPLDESITQSVMTFFGDVSCLTMFGMPLIQGNVAVWYLSGLLVSIVLTYPFIVKYREKFTFYMTPIIAIFSIAYMLRTTGTILQPFEDAGKLSVVLKGTLTSLALVCLGYFSYECGAKIKEIDFTRFGRNMLAVIELSIWFFVFIMSNFYYAVYIRSYNYSELLLIVLTLIGMIIVFSQSSSISYTVNDPKKEKILRTIMLLTFLLYLCQYYQMYFASRTLGDWPLQDQYIFMIVSISLSIVFTYFVGKGFIKLGNYIVSKSVKKPPVETKTPETV